MNNDIAEIIKGYIEDKSYVDRIKGVVKTLELHLEGKIVRYPIACDVDYKECKRSSVYLDLVPDSKKKSVFYFEEEGSRVVERKGRFIKMQSSLRLIGWLNIKKLGYETCSITSEIISDIIKTLPSTPFNTGKYIGMNIQVTSQMPKNSSIFGKYTYNESQMQHLMYPFDFFALNLTVDYDINPNCLTDFDIQDPVTCYPPTT